ncbi:SMC family ATPase [Staphylococcus sp. SQ8-PEA]|uniref:Nuclease SbcCD subunit C n=1 Tax=Staphylococcus marylandisciuri TaxID=2981529 RepID=A0ABT2QNP2_9STAP|nr:exonuclease subunit SbcC [Staphylococcus marylandisciuri]MCU5745583.1 SMC family ATPase [Staphylococcus marylandisciuri]
MRPLNLSIHNFGPFIKEEINFSQIQQNQLFLISGKTGSGKTMLFDAMVYALFGEASTKDRDKSELRSHFADEESPMSVTFEFRLMNRIFKVKRRAKFTRKGRKSAIPAELDIYEKTLNDYRLIESSIRKGDLFIKELLGVNADQFRQLFILPQGEFKKFLVSNSTDKQQILRTLFNTIRFENIQNVLKENVAEVKEQIDHMFIRLEGIFEDLYDYDSEELITSKKINVRQTSKIIEMLPSFEEIGNEITDKLLKRKHSINREYTRLQKSVEFQKKLHINLDKLDEYQSQYDDLIKQTPHIEFLKKTVKEMNEAKLLVQLIKDKERNSLDQGKVNEELIAKRKLIKNLSHDLNAKEKDLRTQIDKQSLYEELNEWLAENKRFFSNIKEYESAFNRHRACEKDLIKIESDWKFNEKTLDDIASKIENKQPDYEKENLLLASIYEEKSHYSDCERKLNQKIEHDKLVTEIKEKEDHLANINKELTKVNDECNKIKQANDNLGNIDQFEKQVISIQSELNEGDKCPICGNKVESIEQHINFKKIRETKEKQEELHNTYRSLEKQQIAVDNQLKSKQEQLKYFENVAINEDQLKVIQNQIDSLTTQLNQVKSENRNLDSLIEKQRLTKDKLVQIEKKKTSLENEKEKVNTLISDFKKTTQYDDVATFENEYRNKEVELNKFQKELEDLQQETHQIKSQYDIEKNNLTHLNSKRKELLQAQDEREDYIQREMKKIGLTSKSDIRRIIEISDKKEAYENEISAFETKKQKLIAFIEDLKVQTQDKEVIDLTHLNEEYQLSEANLNNINHDISQHEYKRDVNKEKIENIRDIIRKLEGELHSQKEIMQLSDVLSGKNPTKLKLENYVLIHYLENILRQANKRLALMTSQRYQLVRKTSLSQGYSGLEINIFDTHSNKERHITTLSGGETFQASLALALGLSEVVQQESGGIVLESIFIDEGFGTLDQETLDTALNTLISLQSAGRLVGIISHVSDLKQRIPLVLQVKAGSDQSYTSFVHQ